MKVRVTIDLAADMLKWLDLRRAELWNGKKGVSRGEYLRRLARSDFEAGLSPARRKARSLKL